MIVDSTQIPGVVGVDTDVFDDHRGSFSRLHCSRELAGVVGTRSIKQINRSCTRKVGAVRGMHFQHAPHAEMKLIRCMRGRVWDVTVDLPAGSPTFLRWHCEELTAAIARMIIIPEGCAWIPSPRAGDELAYLHTAFYEPAAEGGGRPTDPRCR